MFDRPVPKKQLPIDDWWIWYKKQPPKNPKQQTKNFKEVFYLVEKLQLDTGRVLLFLIVPAVLSFRYSEKLYMRPRESFLSSVR